MLVMGYSRRLAEQSEMHPGSFVMRAAARLDRCGGAAQAFEGITPAPGPAPRQLLAIQGRGGGG